MPENPANPPKPPVKGDTPSEVTRENFAEALAEAAEEVSPRPEVSIPAATARKIASGVLVWPDRTLYSLSEKPKGTAQRTALEIFYNYGATPEQLKAVSEKLEEKQPVGQLQPTEDTKALVQQTYDVLSSFREQHQNVTRLYSAYHGKAFPSKGVQGRIAKPVARIRRVITKPAKAGLKRLAKTGVGQAVKKGATWLAARIGLATIGGALTGGIGTILGVALIAFDIAKAVLKKVLRDPVKALVAGGALLLGALLLPLPLIAKLTLFGLGSILGIAPLLGSLAGLTAAAGAALVGFIVMLIPFIIVPLLTTLGIAAVVTTVVVFVLVAWFMHTSTAARFLVGGAVPAFESAHFDVVKSVAPKMDFENSELPQTLTYTISVVPLEGARLINVSVEDQTTVLREENPPDIPTRRWTVASLDSIWSKTYDQALDSRFSDSIVSNKVTVTADVEGGPAREQESVSLAVRIGSPPEDCPSGWPTQSGYITQGPGIHSGRRAEAIDIGVGAAPGFRAFATHGGTVEIIPNHPAGGKMVNVTSFCDGEWISTNYAHLASITVQGSAVNWGDEIGIIGNTGCDDNIGPDGKPAPCGIHLHYEFIRILPMAPPYIPQSVPYGCSGYFDCGPIRW